MGRPREFDTETALTDAMNVFWEHGYDAASLSVLLDGMGLTRGSLYKAFTDKKTLFLRVLMQYEIETVNPAISLLTSGPTDGLARIKSLFGSIADVVRNGDERGCLLCSAAAGPAAVDDDISEMVHAQLGRMKDAFGTALAQSAAYAQSSDHDRRSMTSLLLTQYIGLRVLVRSQASIETIQDSADAITGLLHETAE